MSKFNTTVTGCTGNIVVGDNAVLTIGASPEEGKRFFISQKIDVWKVYFTSGFIVVSSCKRHVSNFLDILQA